MPAQLMVGLSYSMTSFDECLINENPSFVRPPGGRRRNHDISKQFIANHTISKATHSKLHGSG